MQREAYIPSDPQKGPQRLGKPPNVTLKISERPAVVQASGASHLISIKSPSTSFSPGGMFKCLLDYSTAERFYCVYVRAVQTGRAIPMQEFTADLKHRMRGASHPSRIHVSQPASSWCHLLAVQLVSDFVLTPNVLRQRHRIKATPPPMTYVILMVSKMSSMFFSTASIPTWFISARNMHLFSPTGAHNVSTILSQNV